MTPARATVLLVTLCGIWQAAEGSVFHPFWLLHEVELLFYLKGRFVPAVRCTCVLAKGLARDSVLALAFSQAVTLEAVELQQQ